MSLEHSPDQPGRTSRRWPLLLSIRTVEHELDLSKRRVYQLIAAGKLIRVKIGKASRITSESMLRLAEEGAGVDTGFRPGRGQPKAASSPTSADAARKPKGKSKPARRRRDPVAVATP